MNKRTIDRRDFLKGAAAGVAMLLTTDKLMAMAQNGAAAEFSGPPVKIGVIGLGQWGREITSTLSRIPSAQVAAICDTYEAFVNRTKESAPGAEAVSDYRRLLESSDVEAVVVATPSHLHKDIVIEALQAGKHVYCEAPLAASIDDARAIALAAKDSKQVFQAGLQGRCNPLYLHINEFIRTGVLGNTAQVFAQWHNKQSWRRMAPTPERENEMNWRLSRATSPGLIGEVGIHQLDLANWYLAGLPTAVSGFGSIIHWDDGRDVPDTVQCVFEYPNNVRLVFVGTLVSSFSDSYTSFQGSDTTMAIRENAGWMIKESDAPLLGWEVYAKKEDCFGETGICMIADSTQLLQAGIKPGEEEEDPTREPLYCAFESFTRSIREESKPACGAVEGYQSVVVALTANDAILAGTRMEYQDSWFDL